MRPVFPDRSHLFSCRIDRASCMERAVWILYPRLLCIAPMGCAPSAASPIRTRRDGDTLELEQTVVAEWHTLRSPPFRFRRTAGAGVHVCDPSIRTPGAPGDVPRRRLRVPVPVFGPFPVVRGASPCLLAVLSRHTCPCTPARGRIARFISGAVSSRGSAASPARQA